MQNSRYSVIMATKAGFVAFLLFSICLPINLLGQLQDSDGATKFFTSHGKSVAAKQAGQQLLLANTDVGVEIIEGKNGFYLSRIYGIVSGQDFLATVSADKLPKLWQLKMRKDKGRDKQGITVSSLDGGQLSSSIDRTASQVTLRLFWKGLTVASQANAVDVEVIITVKQGDPLSRWRINVTNRSTVYGLWEVLFPAFDLVPIGQGSQTNHFTIPISRGIVADDPFNAPRGFGTGSHRGVLWPGGTNMQFQSLYDDAGTGLYLVAQDGQGYRKKFYFRQFPDRQIIQYRIGHFPANMGYPAENYQMTYDVCVGPFKGDWYDACQIYRSWALQQQWCQYGPLRTRKNMPKWFKESPLVIKAQSSQGDKAFVAMGDKILTILDFLGADLSIDWYTWQKFIPDKSMSNTPGSPQKVPESRRSHDTNVHNGTYPVMPAVDAFSQVNAKLLKAGGHVKAFVPAKLYDPGLYENGPFAAQAKPCILRNLDGSLGISHRWATWRMCYAMPWWQNRLKEEIVALLKYENVHGMYFDTFYGGNYQCFGTEHGHSHGGGNDMYLAARQHSAAAWGGMKQAEPLSVATGEKCAETAIDLLDGLLVYWSVWPDMMPLWSAVYGDYTRWNGNILSPDSDGYYVHITSLFTEGGQMGRLRVGSGHRNWLTNFDAGSQYTEKMKFLRKLCHYWKPNVGRDYLAYGQLLHPLQFTGPVPMPTFSYNETSRYVSYYKKGLITVPALMNGVFKTHDGDLGVFIVNVTDKPVEFSFDLTPDRYPISESASYSVTPIDETAKRGKTTVQKGKISYTGTIAAYDVLFLEIGEHKIP